MVERKRLERQAAFLLLPVLAIFSLWTVLSSRLKLSQFLLKKGPAPSTQPHNGKYHPQPSVEYDFYSRTTSDRSGGAIHDMLLADAYAYAHNWTYGGACVVRGRPRNYWATLHLIRDLGMQKVLRYACPPKMSNSNHQQFAKVVDRSTFRKFNHKFLTPEWRQHVLQRMNYEKPKKSDSVFRIAVHVRRGDVTPCRYPDRYSPNSLYLKLIEQYADQRPNQNLTVQVTIFSESDSYEPFDIFRHHNYTLKLDTDLAETWRALMNADVLILSKSRFSLVPALLNDGTVVFNPLAYEKLPHWHDIDANLTVRSAKETEALRIEACRHYSHRKELFKQFAHDVQAGWHNLWKQILG